MQPRGNFAGGNLSVVVLPAGSNCVRGNFSGVNSAWGNSACGNFA